MDITAVLAASPGLFALVAGLFGLIVGSFLNVLIYRLPIMEERKWRSECAELLAQPLPAEAAFNLWWPRSQCPHCHHPIGVLENIPVLSYLRLRGRCRHCQGRIALHYPLVELLSGVLAALTAWHFGYSWQAPAALVLTWGLLALSVIDLQRHWLLDAITLPLLWLGIGLALFDLFTDLRSSVLGAIAGYLSLWAVYWVFRLLTGKEGMGQGDFKLLALLGAWLGWQYLPAIIIASAGVGALLGIALMVGRGWDRNVPLPYGPFLAAAGWLTLLWGASFNEAYLRWLGW
ncbi:MAG: A24 family peptidase [Candidatus Competibacteraceae bacterium]